MNENTSVALEKYLAAKPSLVEMIGLLENRQYIDEEVRERVRIEIVKRSEEGDADEGAAAFVLSIDRRDSGSCGVDAPLLERMAEFVIGLGEAASTSSLEAVIRAFADPSYEGEGIEGPNPVLATPCAVSIRERATRLYLARNDASPEVLFRAMNQADSDGTKVAAGMAIARSPLATYWDLDGLTLYGPMFHGAVRERIAWDFSLIDDLLAAVEHEEEVEAEGDWEEDGRAEEDRHDAYLDDCGERD